MFYPYLASGTSNFCNSCITSITCYSHGPTHLSYALSVGLERIKRYMGRSCTRHLCKYGIYRTKGSQQSAVSTRLHRRAEPALGVTPEADRHGVSNLGTACASGHVTVWSVLFTRNAVRIVFQSDLSLVGIAALKYISCMSIGQKKMMGNTAQQQLASTSK